MDNEIIKTDGFLEMPYEAQLLYFHFWFDSDEKLIVRRPRAIVRMLGLDKETVNSLLKRAYITHSGKNYKVKTDFSKDIFSLEK